MMDLKSESQRFFLGQNLEITNIASDHKQNIIVTTGSYNLSNFSQSD